MTVAPNPSAPYVTEILFFIIIFFVVFLFGVVLFAFLSGRIRICRPLAILHNINISNMDSPKEEKKMRVAKVEKGETLLQIDIHFGS